MVCSLLVEVINHLEEETSAVTPSALNSFGGLALKKKKIQQANFEVLMKEKESVLDQTGKVMVSQEMASST